VSLVGASPEIPAVDLEGLGFYDTHKKCDAQK